MRGGAQAHLVETSDGGFYVVKFLENPQHRRILVNELIASTLLRYLQVMAPDGALVSVDERFLAENPQVAIELGNRRQPVRPGWHFGSRFPGHPERLTVYDFFPDAMLREVANLNHFLGALVVDKWAGNADARQAIYYRAKVGDWSPQEGAGPGRIARVASMIDHGFLFNGPHWDFPDAPLYGLAARPMVYESVASLDDFEPWLSRVVHFPEEVLDMARRRVPPAWLDGDNEALDTLLERLLARRRRVPDLLEACRRARPALFPKWR
jgi:hypothetical protein